MVSTISFRCRSKTWRLRASRLAATLASVFKIPLGFKSTQCDGPAGLFKLASLLSMLQQGSECPRTRRYSNSEYNGWTELGLKQCTVLDTAAVGWMSRLRSDPLHVLNWGEVVGEDGKRYLECRVELPKKDDWIIFRAFPSCSRSGRLQLAGLSNNNGMKSLNFWGERSGQTTPVTFIRIIQSSLESGCR
jgi:hypothetical protein